MQEVARVVKKYFRVPADGMFRGEEVLDRPEDLPLLTQIPFARTIEN
jgi:hypothetical protein